MHLKFVRGALLATAAVLLVFGAWIGEAAVAVGLGYTAKTMCSGVFVSGRTPDAVFEEVHADGLGVLGYIDTSIDSGSRTASASVLGLFTRRAAYRDGLGCSLLLDGLSPPERTRAELPVAEPSSEEPADPPVRIEDDVVMPGGLRAVIDRAFTETDPERPARTTAIVVVQHGHVVGERYAEGITAGTPLPGWSMTKSVVNALVGILVQQGRMQVSEPAAVPEWQAAGDARAAITIDQLLHMSSGLRFDEDAIGPTADVVRMLYSEGDAAAYAAAAPLGAAPGTTWHYSNGTTNILSRAIRRRLADDAVYLDFPRRELFDRLGMRSAVLETDAAGTFIGSSYMFATARDWARFGELYLLDGVWGGARLLPEGWVTYSTSPAPADPSHGYGAHFWLKVTEGYAGDDEALPVPAFHAIGREGQFVTIVPSRDVVIVRLGRTRHRGAWDHAAFVREALFALRG